ncbi:MAG: glycosyltransferase family 61 protein, partial [Gemmatimonadota bacterium]|nr:glycosyltransferase family 61 protein [Gemmatimonadota bacterium]
VLGTDRFRPELLQSVRDALWKPHSAPPARRIFISRAKATRRRLLNEEEIWSILEPAGFERVIMEDLSLREQVDLMAETAVLFAIHGAGLTNMMFCAPGTHVVEIADLSFPNPNFYAVASALDHHYWLLPGTPVGDEHPLRRDMEADPAMIRDLLPELLAALA